jgi:hypothetical protein
MNIRYEVQIVETYLPGALGAAEPMWKRIKTYRKQDDAMAHAKTLEKAGQRVRIFQVDLDD